MEPSQGAAYDTLVAALIAAAAIAYAVGAHRLAVRRAWRPGPIAGQGVAFAAGLYVLATTLLGPLDAWTERSFALHMAQHELLMLVAAPLLVLGRPLARLAFLLPRGRRRGLRRLADVLRTVLGWRYLTSTAGSCAVQTVALFAWHVPAWFRLAATHPGVHALQHATFLATALAFWWAVLHPGRRRARAPAAIAALFFTTITTGALGALLTFATRPWYVLPGMTPPWGMSLVDDQALAGLLMWVPGGTVYVVVALVLLADLLREHRPTAALAIAGSGAAPSHAP